MKIKGIARYIIETLEQKGYEAYIVGGCLRDECMGRASDDVDVTTSATPDEVKSIFDDTRETGIKHGTVLVLHAGEHAEVTTFRTESSYSDGRHPDEVVFVKDINKDLARRDFTINAMAFSPARGMVDPFGGREDIQKKIIRAVGDPEKRFGEDALRILRCVRFSAVLDFEIEEKTARAAQLLKDNLKLVSRERVFTELYKTILHANYEQMKFMLCIAGDIFPNNITDESIKEAVRAQCAEAKWAWLCGNRTGEILSKLKSSSRFMNAAKELSTYREQEINDPCGVFYKLKYVTPMQLADYKNDKKILDEYNRATAQNRPLYPSELAVDGRFIQSLGFKNEEIGKIQKMLFEHILIHPEDNNTERLTGVIERSKAVWKQSSLNRE